MKTVILDHDAGTNPDDCFALLMLLNATNSDVRLVISGNNYPVERARFIHKIIEQHGTQGVVVCAGDGTGHIDFNAWKFIEGYEPHISTDYLSAIKEILETCDNVTYVAIQGLSNLATLLRTYPAYQDTFNIVHMGMNITQSTDFISGGTNMEADALAAKYVYGLGLTRLTVVGSHTTQNDAIRVTPETDVYKKLARSNHPNHHMLIEHLHDFHNRHNIWPALHDPLTTSVALGYDFVSFTDYRVEFDAMGRYKLHDNGVLVRNSEAAINQPEKFMGLMADLV